MTEQTRKPHSPPERIVKAARRLYFAQRVDTVSTDQLAKEAAVSKTTMYKYFENADAILRAVVEAEAERFEAGIALEADSPAALRAALVEYGTRLLGFLNEADVLRFSRLMYEQARSHPDVAKTFYDAAYGRSHAKLAAFIGQGIAVGHVRSALTGGELAEMLLGMWEPVRFVRAQLALTDQPYADPAAWSEKCVATLFGEGTALGEDG